MATTIQFPTQNPLDSTSIRLDQSLQGLSPEAAAEFAKQERRRQLANILVRQGLTPRQPFTSTGRFNVPMSWTEGLAQLGQVAAGLYGNYQSDQAEKAALAQESDKATAAKDVIAKAIADRSAPGRAAVPAVEARPAMPAQELPGPGTPTLRSKEEIANYMRAAGHMAGPQGVLRGSFGVYKEGPRPMSEPMPAVEGVPGSPAVPPVTDTAANKYQRVQEALMQLDPYRQRQMMPYLDIARKDMEREDVQAFNKEERQADREARKAQAETQLNQAMLLGLITKDQKDQMIDIQRKSLEQGDALKRMSLDQANELKRLELGTRQAALEQGKTPPGYRKTPEGNLEAIPGGPADVKKEMQFNQDTAMLQSSTSDLDRLAASANQILNHPGLAGITGLRGAVPDIPGTAAADARALLNKLKSQVGFSVLQNMRNNSKTGGALGNISDAEGKRLENNLASVESAQSLDQMKRELQGIIEYAAGAKDRLRDAYNLKHKGMEPAAPITPAAPAIKAPAVGSVEGGFRFKGGDPGKRESWEKVQ